MESFYKQTTVVNTALPAALSQKFDSCSTALKLHYQIVLRVAGETNSIDEKRRLPFYQYLAKCVKSCGGSLETIGGAPDRVHLLIALGSTKALAEFLRELKLLSQTWARREMGILDFAWQDRIEAFTVGATERRRVKAYVQRQNDLRLNSK